MHKYPQTKEAFRNTQNTHKNQQQKPESDETYFYIIISQNSFCKKKHKKLEQNYIKI